MQVVEKHPETVAHIISGCSKLVGTEYTKRHNNVASIINRAICAEYNLTHSKDWWVEPKRLIRNNYVKILWVFFIQTCKYLLYDKLDIPPINYK